MPWPSLQPTSQAPAPVDPEHAPGQHPQLAVYRETTEFWSAEQLTQTKAKAPSTGWRKAVYKASAGTINVGPSRAEELRAELTLRAQAPTHGCHRIAVLSMKGGIGKTTTSVMLGHTLGSVRGDRVIAVDGNPDAGTLAHRVRRQTDATVRDLLGAHRADKVDSYPAIRAFTSQAPSRLEVLGSDIDPALAEMYSGDDYRQTVDALERFYNIVVTDCGTGLKNDTMAAILDLADQLVLVSPVALDGGMASSWTLDWLNRQGYAENVARAVVVLNAVRPKTPIDLGKVYDSFASRVRAVVKVPWDDALAAGGPTELTELDPATQHGYLEVAAAVADGFAAKSR